jgi:hypothetical protein
MRKILSHRLLFITLPFFLNSGQCQSEGFAYAVTTINNGTSEWVALRKLDIRLGKPGNMLLNLADKNQRSLPARTVSANIALPSNSGVAAIAYDRKNNRLFYVSMNNDQLRYIDLATMATFPIEDGSFSKAGHYVFQPASPITRLVIAPDDFGYTITTDGNHLIRFTTNGTPVLKDLGYLVDDAHNNEMSIYNTCANAGGDLVADDAGNLYLITAANRVFKIDIKTRITTFLATISGLPSQFTTNGAAVDENGKLIVCSSVYKDGYFIVDPKTWKAFPPVVNQPFYNCSDLANSNVLHTNNPISSAIFIYKSLSRSVNIKIFPNPVLYDEVSVQFNHLPPGNYTIQLANVFGSKVMEQKVLITRHSQTESIHLSGLLSQAFYYVCILNEKNVIISIDKLAVERW